MPPWILFAVYALLSEPETLPLLAVIFGNSGFVVDILLLTMLVRMFWPEFARADMRVVAPY